MLTRDSQVGDRPWCGLPVGARHCARVVTHGSLRRRRRMADDQGVNARTHRSRQSEPSAVSCPGIATGGTGPNLRILQLQRAAGNRATTALLRTQPVQRDDMTVDLEQVNPQDQADLARRGIQLPAASVAATDPRLHSDYIDRRMNAVGYGIYLGGYLIYCEGLPVPIMVPEQQVDLGLTRAAHPDNVIYPDRAQALASVPFGPPAQGQGPPVLFYRGAGGAVVAPTVLSPATTPRVVETAMRARRELAAQVQHDLAVLAISLIGGMALRALLSRVARAGGGEPTSPRRIVVPESGEVFGTRMARDMAAEGFSGNPYREFARRLNAMPNRLPPEEAAEAIRVATAKYTNGTQGTMPPVQVGNILVVPSRAPIPNAPVMGIRGDGAVIMGRAPRLELAKGPDGQFLMPPQTRIQGDISWE